MLADHENGAGPGRQARQGAEALDAIRIDGDKVAWLILDRKGESANTPVGRGAGRNSTKMLAAVDGKGARGLVIRSAKKAGFAAGADIREFADLGMPDQAGEQLKRAHAVIDRLDRLDIPTIAVHSRPLPGRRARTGARMRLQAGGQRGEARLSRSHAGPPIRGSAEPPA